MAKCFAEDFATGGGGGAPPPSRPFFFRGGGGALPANPRDPTHRKDSPIASVRETSSPAGDSQPAPTPATADPSYIIGREDMLDISVWKEPDVSRVVPVRPDGRISLPLIHDVEAAGISPQQLAGS